MSLGVVLHAAALYNPVEKWALNDPGGKPVFNMVEEAIHIFRMPAFFMVSGFFSLLVMRRYTGRFLSMRLTRIVLPLLSTALIVNTAQAYVLCNYRDGTQSFMACYAGEGLLELIRSNRWVSHLWFLINLALYTVAAYAAWRAPWRGHPQLAGILVKIAQFLKQPMALFLLPLAAMLPWVAAYKLEAWVEPVVGFIDLPDLVHYGLFFLIGMWMFHDREILDRYTQASKTTILGAGMGLAGIIALWPKPAGIGDNLIFYYCDTLLSLSSSVLVLHFFKFFAARPTKIFSYLSDASYSVYLFHHITVIVLGMLLMNTLFNAYMKFTIVMAATLAITLAIHHFLILRIKLLRLLFNGKYAGRQAA